VTVRRKIVARGSSERFGAAMLGSDLLRRDDLAVIFLADSSVRLEGLPYRREGARSARRPQAMQQIGRTSSFLVRGAACIRRFVGVFGIQFDSPPGGVRQLMVS
jgi:hypothetical protein